MVIFAPDGTLALVANKGEPNDDYDLDPEGNMTATTVDFNVGK